MSAPPAAGPADPRAILRRLTTEMLQPRRRLAADAWADTRRIMTDEDTAQTGPHRTAAAPYMRWPLRVLSGAAPGSHEVQELYASFAAQTGKTTLAVNYLGWASEEDPAPVMVILPNAEDAKDWNRDRVQPAIRASPRWRALLAGGGKGRTADKAMRATWIRFRGCKVYFRGSNSQSKRRGKPVKHRIADEVDADEFDQAAIEDLRQRSGAWPGGKLLLTSTPGYTGQGIDLAMSRAQRCHYHVPCPLCLRYQSLRFGQLRWDGGAAPSNADRAAETVRYRCAHCHGEFREHHKPWMLRCGVWVPQGAEIVRGKKFSLKAARAWVPAEGQEGCELMPGCQISGAPEGWPGKLPGRIGLEGLSQLYSPWVTSAWGKVASGWCMQAGRPGKEWVNGILGEPHSPRGDRADAGQVIKLWKRIEGTSAEAEQAARAAGAYRLGECPPGVLVITCSIDLQADRAYAVFRGWGRRCEESWLLWFDTVAAPAADELATYKSIDRLIRREFPRKGLRPGVAARGTIDSGHRAAEVYRLARRYGGWLVPAKGMSSPGAAPSRRVILDKWPDGSPMPGGVQLLEVNTWHYKAMLLGKLQQGQHAKEAARAADGPSARLRAAPPPEWHWPDPDKDIFGNAIRPEVVAYLNQITSEQLIVTNPRAHSEGKQAVLGWRLKPGHRDNHYLDAEVYGAALAEHDFKSIDDRPADQRPSPGTRRGRLVMGSGWRE